MAQIIKTTNRAAGFTLIEVMVVCAIVAILAAIAVPAYTRYVQRGDVVEGTQALAQYRVQMEQYYQDNNTYANGGNCGAPIPTLVNFTLACATGNAGQTYVATATGKSTTLLNNFIYTIDETNDQATTSTGSWGLSSTTAWIVR
ncbi:MAG TPA: type IV pilin protein [Burkholderiaceae bacterium]|nr:type IV pilin protein [Burkholderiaceae bacterium]